MPQHTTIDALVQPAPTFDTEQLALRTGEAQIFGALLAIAECVGVTLPAPVVPLRLVHVAG